jgi:hypothetical protein
VLAVAAGGVEFAPDRRVRIEDAVATARTLGGAAYDLDAVFSQVRNESRTDLQMRRLSGAFEDLARGQRRVRATFTRSGGTWGQ